MSYDDPKVVAALASQPGHKLDKPSDGSQFVVSKEGGFDLLFEDRNIESVKQNRVLCCVYLYGNSSQKRKTFAGVLPMGFRWSATRSDLINSGLPNRTWVVGEGRVAVDANFSDEDKSDTWITPAFNLHASYRADCLLDSLQLAPSKELRIEDEWKKTPTWEDLALIESRKMEAIQQFKSENKVSTLEAKKAIDFFIANIKP